MNIYTTMIRNLDTMPDEDNIDVMSFKSMKGAVEYLMDYIVDEGYIDMDEADEVKTSLQDNHKWTDETGDMEFSIHPNELCKW